MKRILLVVPAILFSVICHGQQLNLLSGLHPRPQVSYLLDTNKRSHINSSWSIAYDVWAKRSSTFRTIEYLQRQLKISIGDTLQLVPIDTTDPGPSPDSNVITVGEINSNVIQWPLSTLHTNDSFTCGESYVLHIHNSRILIAGADSNGTFDAVSTLIQLIQLSKNSIPSLHILDYPDYPIRWVFSQHNMMVQAQVDAVKAIEDSMAANKLNGLQQNDFKYSILDWFDNYYYSHVDSMRDHATADNVEVIPGVCSIGWSQGELIHDPDMAEGIPTTATYYIEGDTGRLIGDPRVVLPSGDFENSVNRKFYGWSYYDPTLFVDSNTTHSGRYSALAQNFSSSAPNGRFIKMLTCNPHEGYHMSAWVKTQGFQGEFNLLAIGFHGGSSHTLTFTQFGVPSTTNGWQQCNVIFNTLQYDSMYVYCGVWSGSAGLIWMDDLTIEDAGMTNMLRRVDDMPTVTGKNGTYSEGRDYAALVDSIMEKGNGSYTCHASPSFKLLAGSAIHNGDTVQIHFIRANPVLNDPSGDGSTMVCVSEDTLYSIIHDQVHRVDSLLRPKRYMMGHDEIRLMNWDAACYNRKILPSTLLAANLTRCDTVIGDVHPGAERFVWSDMFDSLHNAHNNYYLVNGDLSGDWNLIPKNITIVNWNGGFMDSSLAFFERHGFSQVTSPYYDEHDTRNIRAWRIAMEHQPKDIRGMMYTTWAADYSFLTPFADYAWSAGPMIVHAPFDSAGRAKISRYEYLPIDADLLSDPYDISDGIKSATYREYRTVNGVQTVRSVPMQKKIGSTYEAVTLVDADPGTDIQYQIDVTNNQGITRRTPKYFLFHIASSGSVSATPEIGFTIFPNPACDQLDVSVPMQSFEIINALGMSVLREARPALPQKIDIHSLPVGAYTLRVHTGANTFERSFVIVR